MSCERRRGWRRGGRGVADWPYNTTAWQKLRRAKLSAEPLCQPCSLRGDLRPAKAVDHVLPINGGGDPFPDLDG